jgi:iron complex outermembrane receptor protein
MKQTRTQRPYPKLGALALALTLCAPGWGQKAIEDLTKASLEELANIQVTSVSKKEQALSKAGAAVFVITQEDIRRSGMMNVPDLLRTVPGVNVARLDANTWAISIRGFSDRYSDKVLVLIDGRSVYSELFSGVLWDQMNVPLEDIERIEVIRGPGGTVWGANAVNGVINIITKSSKDTEGGLLTASTGSAENLGGLLQFGGKIGSAGTYRVFGNDFNVASSLSGPGMTGADGWHGSGGGFRSDWSLSAKDSLTVQGNLFQTGEGQTLTSILASQLPLTSTFNDRVTVGTGDFQAQYTHSFSNGSELSWRTSFDRYRRFDQGENTLANYDTGLQYHFKIGSRNDLVAGAGYRLSGDTYNFVYDFDLVPSHSRDSLFSTFLQDEIKLTGDLTLTVGAKMEHNAFTGFEFEPSAQLVWTPRDRQSVWLSAARAIRQPSLLDEYLRYAAAIVPFPDGAFGVAELLGNTSLKAENMLDYEVGYRNQVSPRMSADVTAFLSHYADLRTEDPGAPVFTLTPPHEVFPIAWGDLGSARNYGVELSGSWDVTSRWRLSPGFSLLHMNIQPGAAGTNISYASTGLSPSHQAQLRSSVNLTQHLEWDTSAYFVGVLNDGPVPAYTRLDTHLGWKMGDSLYFSVSGQNLLSPHHFEFLNGYDVHPTEIERSIVGKITWRF